MERQRFEVELRSLFPSASEARRVQEICELRGHLLGVDERFLLDYSTYLEGIEHRTRDIRARSTNGNREIIAKMGDFSSASRAEASAFVDVPSLRELLTLMAFLGFTKAVAAVRRIRRYQVDQFEVALQEVLNWNDLDQVHSRFIEVERLVTESQQTAAEAEIRRWLSEAGLTPIPGAAWKEYVRTLNAEANGIFDYENPDWDKIDSLGL